MHYIELEGSYHKLVKGYNSHNGFYNVSMIAFNLIRMVEQIYQIKLPSIKHWFVQRIDIAICYDLLNQENVCNYINNLNSCSFPRRKVKHYESEAIYLPGSTTTLKIYNKLKEFLKNDFKNLKDTDFNLIEYKNTIQGFIRFECEIRKRKLKNMLKKDFIRVNTLSYKDLKNIWYTEFNKFFKHIENDLELVSKKEQVKKRLQSLYKKARARNLFNFFLLIKMQGLQEIKNTTDKSMYYKNIAELKKAGIDFSQKATNSYEIKDIEFNPFSSKEIL